MIHMLFKITLMDYYFLPFLFSSDCSEGLKKLSLDKAIYLIFLRRQ